MNLLNRILASHRIDDWIAGQTLIAAHTLNAVAAEVMASAESDIAASSLKDGLVSPAAFINRSISPLLRDVTEPIARSILQGADANLAEIVDAQTIWVNSGDHAASADEGFAGAGDVAAIAMPLAAGVATAAALPIAAITTTTSFLGLVTTTAISWPVVVGGGALAGLGLATGILNAAKLKDRTTSRLRNKTREFVTTELITGTPTRPSVLQKLAAEFERAGKEAKRLW